MLFKNAKQNIEAPSQTDTLDAFSFLAISEDKFPGYSFKPHKVDGFVSEIVSYKHISPSEFKNIIDTEFEIVDQYKTYLGESDDNPHAIKPLYLKYAIFLFKADNEAYERALYNNQRTRFNTWLSEQQ